MKLCLIEYSQYKFLKMIKILFLASNPENTVSLKLDEEIRLITQKIQASEFRDNLLLKSIWAVRPDDLMQALNEYKPHIVHFSGHGNKQGEIVLMDENRQAKVVSNESLKMLFKTLNDNVRLVVLNACYSQKQAEAIAEVIDCVVGMNKAVSDQAAIVFAASFYRAIGFGCSVSVAVEQSKVALSLEGMQEFETLKLLVKPSANADSIVFSSDESNVPSNKIYKDIPDNLKILIDSGVEFIDVPQSKSFEDIFSKPQNIDFFFYKLKMRQTSAEFVFRVHKSTKIEYAANYLVKKILPHLEFEDYEWSFEYNNESIPSHYTFITAGLKSGITLYLSGNHRRPTWFPAPPPRFR
jgi:hypothetical protein